MNANQKSGPSMMKYIITTIAFTFVCIIFYKILRSPSGADYHIQKYFFTYMFPLIMIFAILLNLGSNESNRKPFLEVFGALTIVGIAVYYYALSNGSYLDVSSATNYLLMIAIGLVGLALVYNALVGWMSRLQGLPGFIAQLIFYLPCVLYDAWLWLLSQFTLTPFAVYGFIIIEIILIIVYIFLPNITNTIAGTSNSVLLVKNVLPLNEGKKTIATSSMLKVTPNSDQKKMGITEPYTPRNYCISLWVFTNPQDPANFAYSRESEILQYGYLDRNGLNQVKPMITYYGGGNTTDQPMERNKFVFYFVNYKDIQMENILKTYIPVIQSELDETSSKIAVLTSEIDDPKLTDTEKATMQATITQLKEYAGRLTNTAQRKILDTDIDAMEKIKASGKLSASQKRDLEKSRTQLEAKEKLLYLEDMLFPDELAFLESQTYGKMKNTFYPMTLTDQKWNHIALNYNDNSVDLFINGELERTFHLAGKDIPPPNFDEPGHPSSFLPQYSDLDTITVGDKYGIDGGICNVVYYKESLTPEQIIFMYNAMAYSDPPVPRDNETKKNI